MIAYNPKDWFLFIFRFHKADTFRQLLPLLIFIGIYSWGIVYLDKHFWHLSSESYMNNLSILHTTLTFVISLLLVFRTNTAYDRWWEGRKHWGALVNNCRNLALKLAAMLNDPGDRAYFRRFIPAYASILNKHLKNEKTAMTLFEDFNIQIDYHKHRPNQVARMIIQKIQDLYKTGVITGDQLIVLNAEVQALTDICGACERIKNTPIPFSYSMFIKKFIFFFMMTMPFSYVYNLGYYVIPVVIFILYVLASLELIAEEIEDPFGNDENDLPTEKIAENIKIHVEEIL